MTFISIWFVSAAAAADFFACPSVDCCPAVIDGDRVVIKRDFWGNELGRFFAGLREIEEIVDFEVEDG